MSAATASVRLSTYLDLGESVMNLHRDDPYRLKDAMRDAVNLLRDVNVPFALFGAHAIAVYLTEHRSTEDINFVVDASAAETFLARATEFGFHDESEESDLPIRRIRHKHGARLDIIFDTTGFADLNNTTTTTIPDIGDVPVAAIEDVAYSKLRTQRSDWPRDPQKRRADYNGLVALLHENPQLAPTLEQRVAPPVAKATTRQLEMIKALASAIKDAQLDSTAPGASTGAVATVAIILAIAAVITAAIILV